MSQVQRHELAPFQLVNPNAVLSESAYTVSTASCDPEGVLYHLGGAMQNLIRSDRQSWLCVASAACSEMV